jgi:hypothetical protein
MRIDLAGICRYVAADARSEDEVEPLVKRACRNMYGEEGTSAAHAVLSILDRHAGEAGSRLEAARRLAEGRSVVQTTSRTTSRRLAPEAIEDLGRRLPEGVHVLSERVTTRTFHSLDEVPESLRSRFPQDVLTSGGGGRSRRHRALLRPFITLLLILFIGAGIPLIRLWFEMREPAPGSAGQRIAELQTLHDRSPQDVDIAIELAGAYLDKMLRARALAGLRESLPAAGERGASELETTLSRAERSMGVSGSNTEVQAAAQAGEQLTRQLLEGGALSPAHELTAHVLCGYFLLCQRGPEAAHEVAGKAAAMDGNDPRVHLLNAAIFEETGAYQLSLDEYRKALAGLAPWFEGGPSLPAHLAWGLADPGTGPGRMTQEAWRPKRREVAGVIRQRIELRMATLQVLMRGAGAGP